MRRMIMIATVGALFFVLSTGAAFAATIQCTGGTCNGTNKGDRIFESPFFDQIFAQGGDDRVRANSFGGDTDIVRGGNGNDRINTRDADRLDRVGCGGGFDKVRADRGDKVNKGNCERISR